LGTTKDRQQNARDRRNAARLRNLEKARRVQAERRAARKATLAEQMESQQPKQQLPQTPSPVPQTNAFDYQQWPDDRGYYPTPPQPDPLEEEVKGLKNLLQKVVQNEYKHEEKQTAEPPLKKRRRNPSKKRTAPDPPVPPPQESSFLRNLGSLLFGAGILMATNAGYISNLLGGDSKVEEKPQDDASGDIDMHDIFG
jgi:hypothetical protein